MATTKGRTGPPVGPPLGPPGVGALLDTGWLPPPTGDGATRRTSYVVTGGSLPVGHPTAGLQRARQQLGARLLHRELHQSHRATGVVVDVHVLDVHPDLAGV